jgi:hypothetical protein
MWCGVEDVERVGEEAGCLECGRWDLGICIDR